MLEFVFNKARLKALIDESPDDQDEVLVRLAFTMGKDSIFPATVIARCQKTGDVSEKGSPEINGCPRPPGCG